MNTCQRSDGRDHQGAGDDFRVSGKAELSATLVVVHPHVGRILEPRSARRAVDHACAEAATHIALTMAEGEL